jgi:hypothetical protein
MAAFFLLFVIAAGSPDPDAADPFPADRPGADIGGALRSFEPSSVVWHARPNELFVTDDDDDDVMRYTGFHPLGSAPPLRSAVRGIVALRASVGETP